MSHMFKQCEALESLDLSGFDTANVTNMSNMFRQCKALKSLDIRNFDIGKVTNFTFIFENVGKLYYEANNNKTSIRVTMALWSVLEDMNVDIGSYAVYFWVDNLPG